jgi:glycosyltransferase involved in cell wall biosynthesis
LLVSTAAAADRSAVDYEVAYLLPWKQQLVPELEALGVPTHGLAGRRGLADLRWLPRLRALARDFDIVHVHSPAVAALARVWLRAGRHAPILVSTEHNVWSSHGRLTRIANAATAPLDRVRWAVSDEVVRSMWPRWRAQAEVLVQGVPVSQLDARRIERPAARIAQGWSPDDVVVAIVANLRANKDYPTLFEAASIAMRAEPRLRFVSIGQGPLETELRAALATRGLDDRFVMLGYHADPCSVIVGADVFTLTSRHEGLPISLLEGMALGLAPVVTDVGGVSEVVTDGVDGLLVPPARPDLLAAAYERMAVDVSLRTRLGTAAHARASDYDIGRTARAVEARYAALLASRRARAGS